ncbi:hypothetical protein V8G54_000039 (mitochondrion) [Vigna mungo]|uniref:Translocon at the inner envelope membrane of chloroplasts 214 n=1 Tax=Vigna mungo TaxID=3915 RepID=A0AAQ3PE76_VIGMU
METKIDLFTKNKIYYDDLYNHSRYRNEEKRNKLSNEFINRTKLIDKKLISLDIFENKIRFCNDETKKKYLTQTKDPFLNGPFRGRIKKGFSTSIQHEKTYKKNHIFINKIKDIFLSNKIDKKNNSNSPKLEENKKTFDNKLLVTTFLFNLISQFSKKLVSSLNSQVPYKEPEQVKMNSNYDTEKKTNNKNII